MVEITINGRKLSVDRGEILLHAAKRAGVEIPTLCSHEGLPAKYTLKDFGTATNAGDAPLPGLIYMREGRRMVNDHVFGGRLIEERHEAGEISPGYRQSNPVWSSAEGTVRLLAAGNEVLDGFFHRLGGGAHHHDHPFGVGRAHVVEELVVAAGERAEAVHGLLHEIREGVVIRVAALPRLKEHVRVLGRAAQHRMLG